ncbi:MAG: hypothetical protein QHI48_06770 [Bacteroidota bacterium]|nr:hypothetical protein [Bacteroidota bacterium]
MARFRGIFSCTLDEKGRFVFPKKLRQSLPPNTEHFVIREGHERCLYLYTLESWESKENEYDRLNDENPEHRLLQRLVAETIEEVTLDGQYRLMIPSRYIEHARLRLKGMIRVAGQFSRIEIWDPDEYAAYKSLPQNNRSFSDVSASVLGGRQP